MKNTIGRTVIILFVLLGASLLTGCITFLPLCGLIDGKVFQHPVAYDTLLMNEQLRQEYLMTNDPSKLINFKTMEEMVSEATSKSASLTPNEDDASGSERK